MDINILRLIGSFLVGFIFGVLIPLPILFEYRQEIDDLMKSYLWTERPSK